MNTVANSLRRIVPRSIRAAVQLGLAALGTVVILGSLLSFATVFIAMPPSESGFAEGLAIVVFGLYALAGFVVLAAGLWIPQRGDDGIQFSSRQRTLLAYGVVAPIVGVLAIPIGSTLAPPLADPLRSVLVVIVVALILSGPFATLSAVGMKLRSAYR